MSDLTAPIQTPLVDPKTGMASSAFSAYLNQTLTGKIKDLEDRIKAMETKVGS